MKDGKSRAAIGHNIKLEMAHGKSQKQAVAIALAHAEGKKPAKHPAPKKK